MSYRTRIKESVLHAIDAETERAQEKHSFSLERLALLNPERAAAVLAEETGEVAEAAMNYGDQVRHPEPYTTAIEMTRTKLRAELVQVASVAIRWLETLG